MFKKKGAILYHCGIITCTVYRQLIIHTHTHTKHGSGGGWWEEQNVALMYRLTKEEDWDLAFSTYRS